jgi:hypothetical protein
MGARTASMTVSHIEILLYMCDHDFPGVDIFLRTIDIHKLKAVEMCTYSPDWKGVIIIIIVVYDSPLLVPACHTRRGPISWQWPRAGALSGGHCPKTSTATVGCTEC